MLNKQEMISYLESNYGSWDDVTSLLFPNLESLADKGWGLYNTRTPSNPEYTLRSGNHLMLLIWEHEVNFKTEDAVIDKIVDEVEKLLAAGGCIGIRGRGELTPSYSDISNYYTKTYTSDEVTADSVCTVVSDIRFYITEGLV